MPRHIVSFSGGKDSTAMLLLLLERGDPIDEVIYCDTGMEYPELVAHVEDVERRTGIKITRMKPKYSFEYYLTEVERFNKKAQLKYFGWGWPLINMRWCTRIFKTNLMGNKFKKDITYVGIAYDEPRRYHPEDTTKCFPLYDAKMTEADCLQYCYDRVYDFHGYYKFKKRGGCWCCPFQGIGWFRTMRKTHPELWQKMLEYDDIIKRNTNFEQKTKQFSPLELEARFAREDEIEASKTKLF